MSELCYWFPHDCTGIHFLSILVICVLLIVRYHRINAQFFHRHCCFPSSSKLVFRQYFYLSVGFLRSKSFSTSYTSQCYQGCSNYKSTLCLSTKIEKLFYSHLQSICTEPFSISSNIFIKQKIYFLNNSNK